jgi:hypothetical protein
LYNNQCNAQYIDLRSLRLTCFGLTLSSSSRGTCTNWQLVVVSSVWCLLTGQDRAELLLRRYILFFSKLLEFTLFKKIQRKVTDDLLVPSPCISGSGIFRAAVSNSAAIVLDQTNFNCYCAWSDKIQLLLCLIRQTSAVIMLYQTKFSCYFAWSDEIQLLLCLIGQNLASIVFDQTKFSCYCTWSDQIQLLLCLIKQNSADIVLDQTKFSCYCAWSDKIQLLLCLIKQNSSAIVLDQTKFSCCFAWSYKIQLLLCLIIQI